MKIEGLTILGRQAMWDDERTRKRIRDLKDSSEIERNEVKTEFETVKSIKRLR